MEICFENKTKDTYEEIAYVSRRIQENAECVVPDINDDIGRIVSTQTEIMLKAKEQTARGLCVSGEVNASVLYITEAENKVSFVNTTKGFEIYFDSDETGDEMLTHVKLAVHNCEARAINPRKLSINFDIGAQVYSYREADTRIESFSAPEQTDAIHLKYETVDVMTVTAVCEKSIAVSEQLMFPSEKAKPGQLICKKADFSISETQFVGTKAIIKGVINVAVKCASDEAEYPVCADFTLPFSQIIDTGKEQLEGCSVIAQQTSSYYRLVDTINGEKALDAEIHAVIQLVCRSRQKISYISDAYSNRMPVNCTMNTRQYAALSESQRFRLNGEEHISIAEDCKDVLNVFSSLCRCDMQKDKIVAVLQFDIIYRNTGGSLSSVRRAMELETDFKLNQPRVESITLNDINIRADGALIEARANIEIICREHKYIGISALESLILDEDEAYDMTALPSITLVRVENESLWELAKQYHSSIEQIEKLNDTALPIKGRILLIPKVC